MKNYLSRTLRRTLVAVFAVFVPVVFPGCDGSETGNPSLAKLQLSLRATDPAIASVGDIGNAIRVQELWLSVARIAAVGCGVPAEEVLLSQPMVLGDLARGLDVGELPAGDYCGLHLTLEPVALPTLPAGVAPGMASIGVYGSRADAVPFAILSVAPLDLSIPGTAFTVHDGDALLLAFDVSAWLRDAVLDSATVVDGTAVLDGREHPAITSVFESQLSVSLHHDADADGHVDVDEAALASLH
jgi:hypothetical protein